jgi:superfamily II DNA/RNA helicase
VGQIDAALAPLAAAAGLTTRTVFGGVGQQPQVNALRRGVDIVVACPGRLEDLIGQGHCSLDDVSVTVLDEADHMADLGFLPGVRRILARTPKRSQRLLFSATLDKAIDTLVKQFLHDPVTHQADSAQSPVVEMSHHVLHVDREHRLPVLVDLASAPGRTMVFTRTKYGAKTLARQLNKSGVPTVELHGNLGQGARTRNLDAFHSGKAAALVATDIAARGIHVDDVSLVVHADPPAEHKAYLHRSGRTARAGNAGTVVTLMTSEQVRDVRDLTRAAGIKPTTTRIQGSTHPVLLELAPGERTLTAGVEPASAPPPRTRSAGNGGSGANGGANGGGRNRRRRGRRSGSGAGGGGRQGQPRSAQQQSPGSTRGGRRSGSSRRTTSAGGSHSAAGFSSGRR